MKDVCVCVFVSRSRRNKKEDVGKYFSVYKFHGVLPNNSSSAVNRRFGRGMCKTCSGIHCTHDSEYQSLTEILPLSVIAAV